MAYENDAGMDETVKSKEATIFDEYYKHLIHNPQWNKKHVIVPNDWDEILPYPVKPKKFPDTSWEELLYDLKKPKYPVKKKETSEAVPVEESKEPMPYIDPRDEDREI